MNQQCFVDVKYTRDNVIKLQTEQGIGICVCKAQILSSLDEEYLWSTSHLGVFNPSVLLNTVVFMVGKGFALCAGKEHQVLRSPSFSSQFQFFRDDEGQFFIRYIEEIGLKTNKGGIKLHKITPKEVDLYPIDSPDGCPVHLILTYLLKLPIDCKCSAFYLQPQRKFTESWFQDRLVGLNKLRDTVKDICKEAGLPGFYTNHSLRSVAATKMYRRNIDVQLIHWFRKLLDMEVLQSDHIREHQINNVNLLAIVYFQVRTW